MLELSLKRKEADKGNLSTSDLHTDKLKKGKKNLKKINLVCLMLKKGFKISSELYIYID